MQPSSTFRSFAVVIAFAVGASFGCRSYTITVPDHCYNAAGDQTCAGLYGSERPFCVGPGPGDSCDGVTENHGCVTEPPPQECYSPCGNATVATEDSSCLGVADDTETDGETGDAEGDGDGDGDGDGEPEPICGDGVVDADEQCDDGNRVNDDECTNNCTIAVCGDGIVQAVIGETCDDTNMASGDSCAPSCELPGTVLWEQFYDFDTCIGTEVVVTSTGNIVVAADCTSSGNRLVALDPDGAILWNVAALAGASNVAVSPTNTFAVGGEVGTTGQTRYFDGGGTYVWSENVTLAASIVNDVAIDGSGAVISAGGAGDGEVLARYSGTGELVWIRDDPAAGAFVKVATNSSGRVWALRDSPPRIESFTTIGAPLWESPDPLYQSSFGGIGVGEGNALYWAVVYGSDFALHKVGPDGTMEWVEEHPGWGLGVAGLPDGGALVAGLEVLSDGDFDGLLAWFADDGTVFHELVFDGMDGDGPSDYDGLQGIVLTEDGYGVAVGFHDDGGGDQLWVLKFAF